MLLPNINGCWWIVVFLIDINAFSMIGCFFIFLLGKLFVSGCAGAVGIRVIKDDLKMPAFIVGNGFILIFVRGCDIFPWSSWFN